MSEPGLGARLGAGKEAEVFACASLVVKLYKPTVPKRSLFRPGQVREDLPDSPRRIRLAS
jgi:hypothetical protein